VTEKKQRSSLRIVGIAVVAVLVAIVVFSSYAIVPPGHRGVVVMLGRVERTALGEGFHLVLPPVARQVIPIDVRTKKLEVISEAASRDLQTIQVSGVLNYHLEPVAVGQLYQEVGTDYESIIIVPALQEAIKAATAQFRIDDILKERAVLKGIIQDGLRERLAASYIIVDQFSLANVEFSAEFDRAIEQKQVAEQTALQKQYELQSAEKEVEIALARAEGEKQAAIIAAEGRAEARRLEAIAEAEALRIIAAEIQGNEDLIQYQWATQLAPGVSTIMLPSDQGIIMDASSLAGN